MADLNETREPIEQLAEEFLERRRQGDRASVDEYADAYPDLADEIRDLFPTMLALEKLGDDVPDATQPMVEFAHPRELGDLRLVRELGRGGMGVVYEAIQESLGRRVAVKILPGGSLNNPRLLERFKREARTAANLQHPHIVPVFGVGEGDADGSEGGLHYLIMQIVDGVGLDVLVGRLASAGGETTATGLSDAIPTDLADELAAAMARDEFSSVSSTSISLPKTAVSSNADAATIAFSTEDTPMSAATLSLKSGAFNASALADRMAPTDVTDGYWRAVARIMADAADALGYAHQSGTLHRDIKPGNLLLDRRGHVWITDFGLAKAVGGGFHGDAAGEDNLSRTGELVGTLRYMAPEQLGGEADARSDLYSLGLTLYELMTWRPAYGPAPPSEMVRRITQDSPPPPSRVNASVPRDLETIVLKAIAREPDDRYQSGEDLAADLRRYVGGQAVAARRESPVTQATRWTRKNPLVAGLATAVVLLGSAVAAMVVFPSSTSSNGTVVDEAPSAPVASVELPAEELESPWPPPGPPGDRRRGPGPGPGDRRPRFEEDFGGPPPGPPGGRLGGPPPPDSRPGPPFREGGPPPRREFRDDRRFEDRPFAPAPRGFFKDKPPRDDKPRRERPPLAPLGEEGASN